MNPATLGPATATPRMAREFDNLSDSSWIAVGYLLAATIAAPTYGRMGDRYGPPQFAVGGALCMFAIGSVACALAPSMGLLIAARALQTAPRGAFAMMTIQSTTTGPGVGGRPFVEIVLSGGSEHGVGGLAFRVTVEPEKGEKFDLTSLARLQLQAFEWLNGQRGTQTMEYRTTISETTADSCKVSIVAGDPLGRVDDYAVFDVKVTRVAKDDPRRLVALEWLQKRAWLYLCSEAEQQYDELSRLHGGAASGAEL